MKIGVPKEIKAQEYRVGLNVESAYELVAAGHEVFIQSGAGLGIGDTDSEYKNVGAVIVNNAEDVFDSAELIIKVKEPMLEECKYFSSKHTLFTFLHLAAAPDVASALIDSGVTAIAYETVTDNLGRLPILAPMSEVAGRYSVQAGARALEKINGGRGVLLSGIPGVARGKVVILGAGVAGLNAMKIAVGMGARVSILDTNRDKLQRIDDLFGGRVQTFQSNKKSLEDEVLEADLVIGAVLIPGAKAPFLVSKEMVANMKVGSAVVDISIDQGGCIETSRPTSHVDPMFIESDVVHYCVSNMPSAAARTSNSGLNNVTLDYVKEIAEKGAYEACMQNKHIANGLNIYKNTVCHPHVASSLGTPYKNYFET